MTTVIQLRRDTTANWASVNPVLAAGEPAVEKDTGKLKVGDGTSAWSALPYILDVADLTPVIEDLVADAVPAPYTDEQVRDVVGSTIVGDGDFIAVTASDTGNSIRVEPGAALTELVETKQDAATLGADVAADPTVRAAFVPPKGGRAMSLGDSIVANGIQPGSQSPAVGATGLKPWVYTNDLNWLMLASLLSQGKLQYAGAAGSGGYTTAQILAEHVPVVAAEKPDYCFELGGTNDVSLSVPLATTVANLTDTYQQLVAAGITPVLCSLLPRNGYASDPGALTAINAFKARYAQDHGLPFVDLFSALVDASGATANFDTGLASDGTHPTAAGARRIAQAVVDQFVAVTRLSPPLLVSHNATDGALGPIGDSNNLFITDSNADGIPDSWTLMTGTGGSFSLDTVAEVAGKAFHIKREAAGSDLQLFRGTADLIPGHRYYLACKLKTTVTSGSVALSLATTDVAVRIFAIRSLTSSIDLTTLAVEFTMPTGLASNNAFLLAEVNGAGSELWLGQCTFVDLTAKGIAA